MGVDRYEIYYLFNRLYLNRKCVNRPLAKVHFSKTGRARARPARPTPTPMCRLFAFAVRPFSLVQQMFSSWVNLSVRILFILLLCAALSLTNGLRRGGNTLPTLAPHWSLLSFTVPATVCKRTFQLLGCWWLASLTLVRTLTNCLNSLPCRRVAWPLEMGG